TFTAVMASRGFLKIPPWQKQGFPRQMLPFSKTIRFFQQDDICRFPGDVHSGIHGDPCIRSFHRSDLIKAVRHESADMSIVLSDFTISYF
ncbi:hypothetical protein, partial [Akkermansia sp.]